MNTLGRSLFTLFTATALAGCGGSGDEPLPVTSLAVQSINWNAAGADAGKIAALAERGGTLSVFGDKGALVFTSGVLTATDSAITTWKAAGPIPAADGAGIWIAAVDGDGHLRRLRDGSTFEDVTELYGLMDKPLDALSMLSKTETAFSYEGGLAVANGATVTRFDHAFGHLAGAGGRAAGADAHDVSLFTASTGELASYPLPGVVALVFDAAGMLYAETTEGLYQETTDGRFSLRYTSDKGALHGLALSGTRVWFSDGEELGAIEEGAAHLTEGAKLPADGSLIGSESGDIWVQSQGALSRFAPDNGGSDDELAWNKTVQPVFLHNCTPCHAPGGAAGIDLSTYDAWVARRALIHEQVVTKKAMPPAGLTLSDADRQVIDAWTSAPAK